MRLTSLITEYETLHAAFQSQSEQGVRTFLVQHPKSRYEADARQWLEYVEVRRRESAQAETKRAEVHTKAMRQFGIEASRDAQRPSEFWRRYCSFKPKTEFETTAAYEARIPRLDPTRRYFFRIDSGEIDAHYNADAKTLTVDMWRANSGNAEVVSRLVGEHRRLTAIGVATIVQEYEFVEYSIQAVDDTYGQATASSSGAPKRGSTTLSMSVADARCVKDRGVVVVGVRLARQPECSESTYDVQPTVDNPALAHWVWRRIKGAVVGVSLICDGRTLSTLASDQELSNLAETVGTSNDGTTPTREAEMDPALSDRGPEFGAYYERLVSQIRRGWVTQATDSGAETTVGFSVLPDGRLAKIRVVESSGDPRFDQSVLKAVLFAQGLLGPPPEQHRSDFADVHIRFRPTDLLQ